MTTVILSVTLAFVFAIDVAETDAVMTQNSDSLIPEAEAKKSGAEHTIQMEAVKMPDGMYAYRMVDYELTSEDNKKNKDDDKKNKSKTRNLVDEGVYSTDPQIPGPTLVFSEGDKVNVTLTNSACENDFVTGGVGASENSRVGIHVHGVHYDISDDATYKRMNMSEDFLCSYL